MLRNNASPVESDRKRATFGSPDSLAGGLADPVSLLQAPGLILTFAILSLLQLAAFELGFFDWIFSVHDYVAGPHIGGSAVSIRTFMLSFFIAFSIFSSGTAKARFLFCLDLCFRFIVLCAILDAGSIALYVYTGTPFPMVAIQVMAGFAGIGVFAFVMIRRGAMPSPEEVVRDKQPQTRAFWLLGVTGAVAMVVSTWAALSSIPLLDELRQLALLGGLGPGVILFLLVMFAQLYVAGVIERRLLSRENFRPPVTIIVPAHNEEYVIGQTIRHIDRAALHYGSPVEVIVLDNASSDDTGEVVEAAISICHAIDVRLVRVDAGGKAAALNRGVEEARHDFIVRIDADTLVREDNLTLAMQNFGDPKTGAVGGVPLPPGGALFDAGRLVEVILKHGYYSPSLSAASGLVGVPGMFVVYRAEALHAVGRFAGGMNGEDTDVSLRIAELGYRTLVDQRVSYISEVPTSFAHLREQRLRWFRSVFHVSARAHSLISSPNFSIRGKLVLPYMLLNTARRAMMIPLAVFGLLELGITSGGVALPHWQAISAVLIGSPMLAATFAILVNFRPGALLSLPAYVLFRALRSWYTLEATLSIPITSTSTRIQIGREAWPETRRPLSTPEAV